MRAVRGGAGLRGNGPLTRSASAVRGPTDGRRTASLRALTDCVVAVAAHDQIDRGKLAILAGDHRREEQNRDERK